MPLQLALSVAMFLICLAPSFAAKPTDKSKKRVEIRLAETHPADDLIEAKVVGTNDRIYLHKKVVATNKDVAQAVVTLDARGKPAIGITFTKDGSKKIAEVSENHIGKRVAILVDGKVISAPTIRARISKKAEISGNFSEKEAARIANALNAK